MKKTGLAILILLIAAPIALAGWLQVADCEADENWTAKWESEGSTVSGDTLYYVEGEQAIRLTCATSGLNTGGGTARLEFDPPRDLGRNPTDDDYVYLAYYLPNRAYAIYLRYWTRGNLYLGHLRGESGAGWHFVEKPRDSFTTIGSPDWGHVDAIELYVIFLPNATETWIAFDDWRHVTEDRLYLPIILH